MTRREFLSFSATLAAGAAHTRASDAQAARTRLILLGTGGGPRPRKVSSASAQVIVADSISYRFDARDRSFVISGDTAPSDNLVKLAQGVDVLVHSAMYPPAIERLVARVPNATALKASILAHQTSAEDAGRIAQAAGAKTLVLSHLVPPDDPEVTDDMWIQAARIHYRGPVVVGKDLWEI
jgi:ribonuclease BN (tRNA processing enzyme)